MKKLALVLGLLLTLCSLGIFAGCGQGPNDEETVQNTHYFPAAEPADEVYVFTGTFADNAQREMLSALQGLIARDTGESGIYIALDENYLRYYDSLKEAYPDTTWYETDDLWSLFEIFSSSVTDMGYTLYKSTNADMSRNNAVTLASAEGWAICDEAYKVRLEELGYVQKADGSSMTQEECFDAYKDKLNNDMIFHLHNTFDGNIDYCIMTKNYMFAIEDSAYVGSPGLAFFEKVMDWAEDNIPIFGTGGNVNEDTYTSIVSINGAYNLPSEWAQNLSILAALQKTAKPKYEDAQITPEEGKHYMAFYLTDGDNVQIQMGTFPYDERYFGSSYRGEFPMTWGIAPTLADLCSPVLDYYYENMTRQDSFIAGPSGIGYCHPSNYSDAEFLAEATDLYMAKAGLRYVNIIDMLDPQNISYLDAFGKQEHIDGGFFATGVSYAGGNHSVYWSNGKPFVTIADALWSEISLQNSVAHITETASVKDYTDIAGYSLVCVHAWSHDMSYLNSLFELLPNDIELVTVNQLLDMVSRYVPQEDVTDF